MKNKTVGILTLPLINNYGGILQAYALKEVFLKLGYKTLIIDYRKYPPSKLHVFNMSIKNFIKRTVLKSRKLELAVTPKIESEISINASNFIENELGPRTKPVYNFSDLVGLNDEVDIFIVGSDQVWRPEYTPNIRRYFFDFVKKGKKKIAYAASFGSDNLRFSKDDFKDCKVLINKFDAISVREKSAVSILKERFSANSEFVLDPTLLLSRENYLELIDRYNENKCDGNLFCYILDKNEFSRSLINDVAEALKLEPFEIKPKPVDFAYDKSKEYYIYPFMTKWIRAFLDSEYVIVDSFHGCVFAIIFNKPFIAIGNAKRGLARFKSLLSAFDLSDRLILNDESFDKNKITRDYDWNTINSKISYYQSLSKEFILNSINDNE
ncbi:polysaccharide pyruvyl transferase family protein [Pseudoalteromonas sp. Cn5-37]|uniref:polysaccharide pyruvyl transferase family protein n=1 Tax=Pseudoalteromonas sp. Cn5-37 TaxID=2908886 RepID=UPI001F440145|nr:polysaccharide pyruvyl transferase family protein [Pseudoalteromonas sp. Cn5-37]MCF2918000.1 polysaccharide pyruvyl transferase family protein [Pseudoalteromonas sp. Cn5-37]